MINNLLRGFIYFVVFVLIQVLILNNIHFLRIATPFLYLYFIIMEYFISTHAYQTTDESAL